MIQTAFEFATPRRRQKRDPLKPERNPVISRWVRLVMAAIRSGATAADAVERANRVDAG